MMNGLGKPQIMTMLSLSYHNGCSQKIKKYSHSKAKNAQFRGPGKNTLTTQFNFIIGMVFMSPVS